MKSKNIKNYLKQSYNKTAIMALIITQYNLKKHHFTFKCIVISIDFYFSMEKYLTSINHNICFKDSTSSYYPKNSETFKNINSLTSLDLILPSLSKSYIS